MTPVGEALRRIAGRSTDVSARVAGLAEAADAARGRLDDSLVEETEQVVSRARSRLGLSADHTVVALAGATGSGKSSLFNRITGLELATVGVRRPTTSHGLACTWGPGADDLLGWLEIPPRHRIDRYGLPDGGGHDEELAGLVLLDLPDHDSTEVAHHVEVARLVALTDMMVWVLDPQKYADAAVHDRFLRPLSTHAEVMLVVLNRVDELPNGSVETAFNDVRRLLEQDGLAGVPLLTTSATTGAGLPELRALLAERVRRKHEAQQRVVADVSAAAERLGQATGSTSPGAVTATVRRELVDACADAAGVPVIVDATRRASLVRAKQATGWPVTKWLSRFKPDPLRRLHLAGGGRQARELASALSVPRSSIPAASGVQRARVDAAARSVTNVVTAGLARPWAESIRAASRSHLDGVADALDVAVTRTDLGLAREPRWWGAVRVLQWLLFVVAVAGGIWLGALAVLAYLQFPAPADVDWHRIPVPTLLLVGGAIAGIVVAALSRFVSKLSARRRARRADARLREAIQETAERLVLAPIADEVDAYLRCRNGIQAARGG